MARLIDADKIRYSDLSGGQVPDGVWCTWKDRIDDMPTVEAIPMWFIEKKLKWYQHREKYLESFPGVNDAEISRETIEYLIKDWETENDL